MIELSMAVRTARLAVIGEMLDAKGMKGELRLYAGSHVALTETPGAASLLAVLPLQHSAVAHEGRLIFPAMAPVLCQRSGIATWARFTDGEGNVIAQMDVGLIGSGATVELSDVKLFTGGQVSVSIAELTEQ